MCLEPTDLADGAQGGALTLCVESRNGLKRFVGDFAFSELARDLSELEKFDM